MRPAYQTRVIAERDELAARLGKLHDFIGSDTYRQGLGHAERDRLMRQFVLMQQLVDVLDERIGAFKTVVKES